ncbi:hypothetical protein EHQ92_14435 [Leptospira biflexa]|jgi:hypothetical protein|uniref:Uncharacterized protein n=1 Tax=Leptospira biflexa serovar Patoc (strain Patoc 1 / ATCC 23582 / Paris) TaxID=456481 RepID=B0SL22_LEPBP|nr:hypothetical protein [Leptospira biflexa]ABZ94846.1 Hypothetical protein LBF_2356 [Leptospira biflexa serovar Patoc strain 'Patoc 1 (Ames)']ABZ98515.1 Conserved hypothetical protein [Leptospira biflexa serovar Patoc strain 'Patoc 1 (Paris)']TGM34533.1 hypothetical protein EHQ80_14550 [Leptospira biflexa]TGM35629.1 hypothetical protein EHQ89_10395 [Leptospira biflexa]TGM43900.1 hypothetical protein EHQ92_14435 [Leptospira biflexa]
MAGSIKVCLDLADMIRKENLESRDKIPTSDTHLRIWSSQLARSEEDIRKLLTALRDAHFIFLVSIVSPDPNLFVYGEDAYVFAEPFILNELKKHSEETLEKLYEASNYKRKSAFQITRELFPKIKEFNNTPLGRAINLSVMLEEFQRMLTAQSYEYTDQWRRNKLQEIFKDEVLLAEELANSTNLRENDPTKRAVDQLKEQTPKEKIDSNWVRAKENFSTEFLLRVHFRKYEFDIVKRLIQTGKLKEEKDIKYVRDTIQLMESRMEQDNLLKRYANEMIELRRYAQAKLNMIRQGLGTK